MKNKLWSQVVAGIGISCMATATYFLIVGLSNFGGDTTAKWMLGITGIIFQAAESACFINSVLAERVKWKVFMFGLGAVLFVFSILVMTLAQQTVLMSGVVKAEANDTKRDNLNKQISSLNSLILSLRVNAKKQSKSKYAQSRRLGFEALKQAAKFESQKLKLINELHRLKTERKQTQQDFFKRASSALGLTLTGATLEFWFILIRSILLETLAVALMSIAATYKPEIKTAKKRKRSPAKKKAPVKKTQVKVEKQLPGREQHPSWKMSSGVSSTVH